MGRGILAIVAVVFLGVLGGVVVLGLNAHAPEQQAVHRTLPLPQQEAPAPAAALVPVVPTGPAVAPNVSSSAPAQSADPSAE
ncbi:hypothetical protein OQ496_02350 [Acetobacter suratthaniensis]|uniref:Uncharacterized protein n=1 Tax=Acetobacter suratthaniensis TaxID=1502841 RepID=A0ABS3LHM3_9PROT|nr:hypothetical protein [Acetobacter suratthaniensis]MBO1327094.1 hypothetical protein [Acetobacter suratthaniensis]MCX2565295.1 hypothetical protein [Acetobacter suratthaniensis]